jgi:hypothetical protein
MIKRIFTFGEPKENLPAYLKLCMKTWEKFLPDYEIIKANTSFSILLKWKNEIKNRIVNAK